MDSIRTNPAYVSADQSKVRRGERSYLTWLRWAIIPILLSAGWLGFSRPSVLNLAASPHTLTYVESSSGLIPPEMGSGRTEIEMVDVNADGNLDLVSIGDHGSPYINTDEHGIMVWFGNGSGEWGVYQNGNFGYGGVALGDVNNDGFVDAGYGMHHNYSGVDLGDQLLEVALGDGSGQNWTPWDDGLASNGEDWGMFSSDFADVDNDGDLDIGSISFGCCAGVHVYLNQGDGTWSQSFGFVGGNSDMHFTFSDFNGDGNSDFAVSHQYGTVYSGDGSGGFVLEDGNLPDPPSQGHAGVSLRDVNHDGRADLAYCTTSGGIKVWSWVASQTWQDLSGSLPGSGTCEATQLFDMDMDGHVDVASFGMGQVHIWGGDGAGGWSEIGSFSTPSPGYLSAFRVGGDGDHNGYADIVMVTEEGSWWDYQNHTRFFKEASIPTDLEIKPVYPQGGEIYLAGSITFVDWISAVPGGEETTVDIELSTTGANGPWMTVVTGLPNGGRYQWLIAPETPSSNDVYLRYTLVTASDTTSAITPAPFEIVGGIEEEISGLEAFNDSPTELGETTELSATVQSGSNVTFEWALGDGNHAPGKTVSHEYPALGYYTAIVTASNSLNTLTTTTTVTIIDQAIAGLTLTNDSPTHLGQATTLTASISAGTHVSFTLDLGDGSPVESGSLIPGAPLTILHNYPYAGNFNAEIQASNSSNQAVANSPVSILAPTPTQTPTPTATTQPAPTSTATPSPTPLFTPYHLFIPVAIKDMQR